MAEVAVEDALIEIIGEIRKDKDKDSRKLPILIYLINKWKIIGENAIMMKLVTITNSKFKWLETSQLVILTKQRKDDNEKREKEKKDKLDTEMKDYWAKKNAPVPKKETETAEEEKKWKKFWFYKDSYFNICKIIRFNIKKY